MLWWSAPGLILIALVVLVPLAFVWYLNVGGIVQLLHEARRRIKVLVVDDHPVLRDGIRALLGLQKDILVVGEAADGQDALEKVHQLSPDVVLMDLRMPLMNGLEATRRISAEGGRARVLVLTQYDEEENVVASADAGALGFVPKRSAGADLVKGIRAVSKGERIMPLGASAS